MIVLTLDGQNNRIVIQDNEVKEVSRNDDTGLAGGFELWYDINEQEEQLEFAKVVIPIDFEGLVFRLVDKDGQQWSTEIIGMTVTGQY